MPKRRKLLGDDGSDDSKRRRKVDVNEACQELLDTLKNHKTEDGRLLCEAFLRAPKRRSLADYYEVVSTPMDLSRVQQKIKMEEYDDMDQLTSDIELLINNAKAYYKKDSQEYQDACDLWNLFLESKNEMLGSTSTTDDSFNLPIYLQEDTSSNAGSEGMADDDIFEELFTAVMTATDETRSLSAMFQLLPSKSKYPDYYRVIPEPIDLKLIGSKIQSNSYQSLADLEKDLLLMVRNAKQYNEPGSQIYRDANSLRKVITNKKLEIEQRKYQPVKTSERIRAKKLLPSGQKWSTIMAALKPEDPEPECAPSVSLSSISEDTMNEELNESDPEDVEGNPQWQIYEAVRTFTTNQGITLSDPFNRLPSRRFYPDYYLEIKQPMSMAKIKTKLKSGAYRSASEVVEDMDLMFENAKRYNRPDSKLYKDACKLQKVMNMKAKEFGINYHSRDLDSSDSDNDDSLSGFVAKKTPGKSKKAMSSAMSHELKKARRSHLDIDVQLKKRMKSLYKTLMEYADDLGRPLITLFLEKPSPKDYPDYYDIIENPIDMRTIDANIKYDKYTTVDALVADFLLMFKNCKHYNEEGSQIYQDAETLQAVLFRKLEELGPFQPSKSKRPKAKVPNVIQQKIRTLYDTVVHFTDNKGKQLSGIFMKLPSRTDYPDYYEVIKRPMDLDKIGSKIKNNNYESLEDLLSDLVLMFDNACKYNEPDSQIYKSALTLQQVALQTKLELSDTHGVPDVKAFVQDILTNLFTSVYNHQDEEGRFYTDSLNEIFEDVKPPDANENPPLTLDVIKRNLDKGRYRRLDRFQQDMFDVFERARKFSRTDSQAFEDSIELQTHFIRLRDSLCKNGELFQSPALTFSEGDLNSGIEALRLEKYPIEQQENELELENKQREKELEATNIGGNTETIEEVSLNNVTYKAFDFVYIEPREKHMEPHIINIQKLWRDLSGEIWIYGCWFYRPNETFHIASKKFLEREVFKSDNYNNTPLEQVVGKCHVMFVKDYFKLKPAGFEDKDVYVCESRYCTRIKTFKKIKVWPFNHNVQLVSRDHPYPMIRVPSVFKDRIDRKDRNDGEEEEEVTPKYLDIEKFNIICEPPEGFSSEDGSVYYEQFCIPSGAYKLGDCCYVRTDQGRNLICRIDRIWVDKDGNAFFHGPWFVQPMELPPLMSKMFYPQEVFLSSIEDTNPLLSICDRCAVLEYKDYISKRPTEVPEHDVYICEAKYVEHEKKFVKLQNELCRPPRSSTEVVEDEFYIFRKTLSIARSEYGVDKSIVARKGQCDGQSPLIGFHGLSETENDESNDLLPSVVSEQPISTTPMASAKKKPSKRLVTGYIIFASEVRKSVVQANPDCNFGDISRIIGTEWKNLPTESKTEYERKAQKQNEEAAKEAAREAERGENYPQSPASAHGLPVDHAVYECHWANKCDFQCEDSQELYDHLNAEPTGHVWKSYGDVKDKEEPIFQCLFHGCGRVKKGAPPFPSIQRLIRHCKEVHVTKQIPKSIPPENRSKNFVSSRKTVASPAVTPLPVAPPVATTSVTPVQTMSVGVQAKPLEPLFVSAPPKQSRLLHTSTYIRYIERLKNDCKHSSNWEAQLNATPENTPTPDKSQLPVHWLTNGAGNHGNVVNALWALRNFMLQDALQIHQY